MSDTKYNQYSNTVISSPDNNTSNEVSSLHENEIFYLNSKESEDSKIIEC